MKKLIAFLLIFVLIFTFVGCKDDELLENEEVLFDINSSQPVDSSSQEGDNSLVASSEATESTDGTETDSSAVSENNSSTVSSATTEETSEEEKFDTGMQLVQSGGIYFPDINETYKYAAEIYRDIVNSTFSYDEDLGVYEIEKDGSVGNYWRVNDSRFDSVAELEEYLDAFFTKECQETFYEPSRFIDYNGHLYAVVGVVATDPTYAGCSFKLTKQTTKRIFFECTGYYLKSYDDIDPSQPLLTAAPENLDKYNTRTVSFVLQATEDGMSWQFTQFGLV
ncbi:MAG: DL-endopeptidase inhibitor IseA family protein [Acutalibacteraceae bacterium]|nr:DL-endopeptidase inhibitor IseA family protein [Acutalibacteraceae bacterium]